MISKSLLISKSVRISKILLAGLTLISTACAGAAPTPAPTATPVPPPLPTLAPPSIFQPTTSPPTSIPVPTVSTPSSPTQTRWQRAGAALAEYVNGEGAPERVYTTLSRAATELLQENLDATNAPDETRLTRALQETVQALNIRKELIPRVLVIPLSQSAGERKDLIAFSFVGGQGVPIVLLLREGATLKILSSDVFGAFDTEGKRWAFLRDLRAVDITGDGTNELVSGYRHGGGSSSPIELEIFRWNAETQKLKPIFRAFLSDWIGEFDYAFGASGKASSLQLTYTWFGSFSAKMIDHVRATEQWTYEAATDAMVRVERTIEPSRTVLQQLNVGEAFFRNGEWDDALRAFDRAAQDDTLTVPPFGENVPAPRGFANFRQGQILALLGRETEARTHLAQATAAGGALARLTDAFLSRYQGTNAGLRAWAQLSNTFDIEQEFHKNGEVSNLNFPTDPQAILFQGGVIAAFLNLHATKAATLESDVLKTAALGVPLGQVKILDWDGDSRIEALLTLRIGIGKHTRDALWLVYQRQGHWRAREILDRDGQDMQILNTLSLPHGKGSAISISWQTDQRYEQRWSWDGTILRQLDFQTLEPLTGYDDEYKVGVLAEPIDF